MKINRGYKFRLYPSAQQADVMQFNADVCRMIYNLALEQRKYHYRSFRANTGRHISFASQCLELTALRSEFAWIAKGSLTAQQQALRDLATSFGNFYEGRSFYPRFKKKGVNDSFRFMGREVEFKRLNKSWGSVRLPKIGEVRFRLTRDIVGKLRNVTVSLDALGWHVSFSTESVSEVEPNFAPSIGIDRGIERALAYSNGEFADFPKATIKALDYRARRAAAAASRLHRGSSRHKKAKARALALKSKAARVRKHFNHVETSRIAKRYGVAVLEDLKTKNMTSSAKGTIENPGQKVAQKAGLNRSILEMGWHQFGEFLEYKMAASGGEVRVVSAAYTSATCSCCGLNEKSNRKSQAVYECCGCGSVMNADTNAALNILRAGTRPAQVRKAAKRNSHLETPGLVA